MATSLSVTLFAANSVMIYCSPCVTAGPRERAVKPKFDNYLNNTINKNNQYSHLLVTHFLLAEENDKDSTTLPHSTGSTVCNVIELSIRHTYLTTPDPKSSTGYLDSQHFQDPAVHSTKLAFVSTVLKSAPQEISLKEEADSMAASP